MNIGNEVKVRQRRVEREGERRMSKRCIGWRTQLVLVLLLEYFYCHIVDSRIVKNNDTTVGTGFDVYTLVFAKVVVAATEVVAYGLDSNIEFVGYAVHGAIGQAVFEGAQFVESDCLCHNGMGIKYKLLFLR